MLFSNPLLRLFQYALFAHNCRTIVAQYAHNNATYMLITSFLAYIPTCFR
jgi:hypothetical protein